MIPLHYMRLYSMGVASGAVCLGLPGAATQFKGEGKRGYPSKARHSRDVTALHAGC